jgi:hypothetical protein
LSIILIISICVNIGLVIYNNSKTAQWQKSLTGWQQAVTERDAQIADLTAKLSEATRPTPTPEPVAIPDPTVTPALKINTIAEDKAVIADWLAALDAVNAATTSGVQFARYLQLMEAVTLARTRLPNPLSVESQTLLDALNEANWCLVQAGALWSAYNQDNDADCGAITKAVIAKFPKEYRWKSNLPASRFNDDASRYAMDTTKILWGIADKRLRTIRAL